MNNRIPKRILIRGVKDYRKIKLQEIKKYYPDWEHIEMDIDCDHTHLHIVIPQKYSVSKVGETTKTNTSKLPREEFGFLNKLYKVD